MLILTIVVTALASSVTAGGQNIIDLDLDTAVDIAMGNSYRIRQLEMGVDRSRYWLQARQASLKSSVYMNLRSPEIKATSEYKWNSDLRLDEIVREDTRLFQMDLAVRQPLIFMGYPTNGYFSLNNKTYQYLQKNEGQEKDLKYYNRLFLKFEQPFFQPNSLKNNIEDAELDLRRTELNYVTDRVNLADDIADDFYDLFEMVYRNNIYKSQIALYSDVADITGHIVAQDSSRSIESIQIRVEMANTRERLLRNQSNIRLRSARLKQRLRLNEADSLHIDSIIEITPIEVDAQKAVEYGLTLRPRMRILEINKRMEELDLDNAQGWNSFRVNLEMTYGLERQNKEYEELIDDEYDNSYSVSLNAYVPIWDWGQHKAQLAAEEIQVKRSDMYIEEAESQIESEIMNSISNLEEYQTRAMNMSTNLEMAREISRHSLEQYQSGNISLQDLLQVVESQRETEENFLDAFIGYRRSILRLMRNTYYDYENGVSLLEKYGGDGVERRVDSEG